MKTLLFFIFILSLGSISFCQAGSLDPSFDGDGILIKNFGISIDEVTSSTLQTDGKCILLGNTIDGGIPKISILRYTATGQLDDSFGNGGIVMLNYNDSYQRGYDIAVQTDGKILIAGVVDNSFAVIRLNQDGSTDTSFGTIGLVKQSLLTYFTTAKSLVIQNDGKIVLAGYAFDYSNKDFAVTRLNSNGTLDNTFSDSIVITSLSAGDDMAEDLTIQTDGKILLCGVIDDGNNSNFGVVRYDALGNLDASFSTDGITSININASNDYAHAIDIQVDNKIIIVGQTENGTDTDFGVVRLLSDGSLDASFNSSGIISHDVNGNPDIAKDVKIAIDGTIYIAGASYDSDYPEGIILAFTSMGSLQTSFNSTGIVHFNIGNQGTIGTSLKIESGNILISGTETTNSNASFFCTRYFQTGSIDPTYNSVGFITTSISDGDDQGKIVLQQNDGKILMAGSVATTEGYNFGITRFNLDGTQDMTFGINGDSNFDYNTEYNLLETATIQADGKIILAGFSPPIGNSDFLVIRVNTDGTIDSSFSLDGMQAIDLSAGGDDRIHSVAIQNDGKVVLVGTAHAGTNPDFGIVRLNADGSLDNTFDTDGIMEIDSYSIGAGDLPYSVSIQNDGKIIVSGVAWNGSSHVMALMRLNTDGSFDTTFDGDGKSFIDISGYSPIKSSKIQTDGKIVVCGFIDDDIFVSRINANGSLDNTFGVNGIFTMDFFGEDDEATDLRIQPDGKIVVTGFATSGANGDIFVLRLNPDGSIDSGFDQDGFFISSFNGLDDIGYSTVIQGDGKILIGGRTNNGTNNDFCVLRLIPESFVNTSLNSGNEFSIYPNPAEEKIIIEITTDLNEIELTICNTQGQVIQTPRLIDQTKFEIDISDLSPGFYMVKISSNWDVQTKLFIKIGH